MSMTIRSRKLVLAVHVASSVGWFGSLAVFIALALTGRVSGDAELVRACYLAMKLAVLFVIVPFSLISLATGITLANVMPWGLSRHYWVLLKLILSVVATFLLIVHTTPVIFLSNAALKGTLSADSWMRVQILAYAIGGLIVVTTATVLAVFKPRGLTPWGQRLLPAPAQADRPARVPDRATGPDA